MGSFVSDFFRLAQRPHGSATPYHGSVRYSSLWTNNLLFHGHNTLLVYSSVDGHLGCCCCILAVAHKAALNIRV